MANTNVTTRRPLAAVIEEITERHERLYGLAELIATSRASSNFPVMYSLRIAVEECEAFHRVFTEYEARATEAGHEPSEKVQNMCNAHHTAESLFRFALGVFDPDMGSYDMEKYNVPGVVELAGEALNEGYAVLPNFEDGDESEEEMPEEPKDVTDALDRMDKSLARAESWFRAAIQYDDEKGDISRCKDALKESAKEVAAYCKAFVDLPKQTTEPLVRQGSKALEEMEELAHSFESYADMLTKVEWLHNDVEHYGIENLYFFCLERLGVLRGGLGEDIRRAS